MLTLLLLLLFPVDSDLVAKRNATEKALQDIAIVERKVMVPMRDGKRMATDVYRPKDPARKYPIIFVRTPYNFNYWDVCNGAPRDMTTALDEPGNGTCPVTSWKSVAPSE